MGCFISSAGGMNLDISNTKHRGSFAQTFAITTVGCALMFYSIFAFFMFNKIFPVTVIEKVENVRNWFGSVKSD
jgi:hypothetical protein